MIKQPGHIYLCGFMGSGKSTLGKKLASLLGLDFIDLDAFIEQQQHKTVAQVFEEKGEAAFRQLERTALIEISNAPSKKIIALGGGTLMAAENLAVIGRSGCLVYLQLSQAAIISRLGANRGNRPLLKNLSDAELTTKIDTLFQQRKAGYEQADVIVSAIDLDASKLRKSLAEKLLPNN